MQAWLNLLQQSIRRTPIARGVVIREASRSVTRSQTAHANPKDKGKKKVDEIPSQPKISLISEIHSQIPVESEKRIEKNVNVHEDEEAEKEEPEGSLKLRKKLRTSQSS